MIVLIPAETFSTRNVVTGTGGETFASSCTAEETHGSQGCQIMIMIDIEIDDIFRYNTYRPTAREEQGK